MHDNLHPISPKGTPIHPPLERRGLPGPFTVKIASIRRFLRMFAILTSLGAYLMLVMGTLVTNTGSGYGCGNSWPFCHGEIIPGVMTVNSIIEYSHRIMSSLDGTFVLILSICTWIFYRKDFRAKAFAVLSILFVVIQGALGALTVVFEGTFEKYWLLSIHFGLSLIALAFVLLLTIRLFQIEKESRGEVMTPRPAIKGMRYFIWGLVVYTYLVVYTGALVAHTGAVLGCGTQVPGCGSTYLPSFTSLAGIQVLHRYAAVFLWLVTLTFLVVVLRTARERRDLVRGAWWAFVLVTLQAASGVSIVLSDGQLLAGIIHVTIISTFFAVLAYLCLQIGWPWMQRQPALMLESSTARPA